MVDGQPDDDYYMNIRKALKTRMKTQKRTQYWLAQQLGISRQRVSAYFSGRNDINGETLGRALDLLGLEIRPKR